ncbi:hypothetical protein GOC19_16155 [Sinorhizobium meliloti]|nr:hypothetical protein [Sinorhizobium meliloti]
MLISRITLALSAIGGILAAFTIFHLVNVAIWLPQARQEGRDQYIAEQAAADSKAEIERKGDDAKLRSMSDYDLCVDGLRSRRLPSEPCDELRGIRSE